MKIITIVLFVTFLFLISCNIDREFEDLIIQTTKRRAPNKYKIMVILENLWEADIDVYLTKFPELLGNCEVHIMTDNVKKKKNFFYFF